MRNLLNFSDYLNDKILEGMDLKISKLDLILSQKMIKILREMKHEIADELLRLHLDTEPQFQVTFVDLGTTPDKVSFIQANKVPEYVEPDIVHGDFKKEVDSEGNFKTGYFDYVPAYKNKWISDFGHLPDLFDSQFKSKEHPVWTKSRSETTMGKFIRKIFGKKYPENIKRADADAAVKQNDYDSFTMMFTATVEANSKILKLVKGEDIRHWYNRNNYFKDDNTLGGSCMKDPSKQNFFDIYCENTDNVQQLVLFPEDVRDKIIGRAIVWKLDGPDGRYFMDRIYTAQASDEYLFIEYAKRQGWLYKSSQSFGWDYNIVDPKSDDSKKIPMHVKLKPSHYDRYPYMDTLQYYNPTTGVITNDYNSGGLVQKDQEHFIRITDTGGGSSHA